MLCFDLKLLRLLEGEGELLQRCCCCGQGSALSACRGCGRVSDDLCEERSLFEFVISLSPRAWHLVLRRLVSVAMTFGGATTLFTAPRNETIDLSIDSLSTSQKAVREFPASVAALD
jgi:hypothetical protein